MCCFSGKHVALKNKNNELLPRNQENVSEWSDMSSCGMLFQWTSNIKIQLRRVRLIQSELHHHHHIECYLFSQSYSSIIAHLALNHNHSLTHSAIIFTITRLCSFNTKVVFCTMDFPSQMLPITHYLRYAYETYMGQVRKTLRYARCSCV